MTLIVFMRVPPDMIFPSTPSAYNSLGLSSITESDGHRSKVKERIAYVTFLENQGLDRSVGPWLQSRPLREATAFN
jgi:hypothetical protein